MRRTIHLRTNGVSLVLDVGKELAICHWGTELTDNDVAVLVELTTEPVPQSGLDEPVRTSFWREAARGHLGRPSLSGSRSGRAFSPYFVVASVETAEHSVATIVATDVEAELALTVTFRMLPGGVISVEQSLENTGNDVFELSELWTWLPLPDHASEIVDFTGRWLRERQLQRRTIGDGLWLREAREGRPGHDFSIVELATTAGATFQSGSVWAIAPAWSGNSAMAVERLPIGATAMAAGELLLPGEVRLQPGENYRAPTVLATYSSAGIDGVSDNLHTWQRSRPQHPATPRPLTLNVWEAVYFDHSLPKLTELANVAASIGVERFVLDDGWFLGRRDDLAGLGDWVVDREVWPDGLHPLVDAVTAAGMQFGLWFEAEMVNPDSNLAREHPEWILHVPGRMPPTMRYQQVLDLSNSDARAHVFGQVTAILSEYPISYIKWDHNRYLVDPAHNGRAAARTQTLAIYQLFDDLRSLFPGLEIESCASGGGRIDLGMLQHADRFWASDTNDARERQSIQLYTSIAIAPELLGTHIGPSPAHSTGRQHSLSFRAITALFGHAGLEWDLTETNELEREQLREWSALYRRNRSLLHSGRMFRDPASNGAAQTYGVVAHDKGSALVTYAQLSTSPTVLPARLRIPGLEPEAMYWVEPVPPIGRLATVQKSQPTWMSGMEISGRVLAEIGLRPPILHPEAAIVIEITRR